MLVKIDLHKMKIWRGEGGDGLGEFVRVSSLGGAPWMLENNRMYE